MFDIGWSEMMVIAILVLIIMGPKELPQALRTVTNLIRKAKDVGRQFQSGVDEIVRETELGDARSMLNPASSTSIQNKLEEVIDPNQSLKKASKEVKSAADDLEKDTKASLSEQSVKSP